MSTMPSPISIQGALRGAKYPMSKQGLQEIARRNGAGEDIIRLLDSIPDKEYDSPAVVSKAIGDKE